MKKLSFVIILAMVVAFFVPCLLQAQRVVIEPPPPPRIVIEAPAPPTIVVRPRVVFPLPPPVVFAEPPEMIVLPETEVYVVPSVEQDIFFYNGFWFRLWEGRWYRSQYYDRGWGFYQGVPGWYAGVYPGWRENYRTHMWGGQPWSYRSIPHHEFRNNWRGWHERGHWKNHDNLGTRGTHSYGGTRHLDKGGTRHLDKGGTRHLDKGTRSGTSGTRHLDKGASGTKHLDKGTRSGSSTISKSPVETTRGKVDRGKVDPTKHK